MLWRQMHCGVLESFGNTGGLSTVMKMQAKPTMTGLRQRLSTICAAFRKHCLLVTRGTQFVNDATAPALTCEFLRTIEALANRVEFLCGLTASQAPSRLYNHVELVFRLTLPVVKSYLTDPTASDSLLQALIRMYKTLQVFIERVRVMLMEIKELADASVAANPLTGG